MSPFRAMKTSSQIKRAMNRESSADMLRRLDIPFVVKNSGAHLIVADAWEFWSGTGKWRHRSLPINGRGVRSLLHAMEKEAAS